MDVRVYSPSDKRRWDDFISASKNGTFLFFRDYMDYHSDRFIDHSLIVEEGRGRILSVLPAHSTGDDLVSHGGLTYGGFLTNKKMSAPLMLDIFNLVVPYLKEKGFSRFVYKTIPHIYHLIPSEEDLYALFIHKAKLIKRDVSSTIGLNDRLPYRRSRQWSVKKSKDNSLELRTESHYQDFMTILNSHLQKKYGISPVHSLSEIQLLAGRFPENIKLFSAHHKDKLVGGVIMYETETVAHVQYNAMSPEGKNLGASDFILDYLINDRYRAKRYFDFGISTLQDGQFLNANLLKNKESFGARTVVYDQYRIDLSSS